ncbi:actin-binding protein IPP [Coccinella septempunctata]|uniref:actin-binding protein IPP n=1 Tax=Coccinella septempunctata TaxID=41139 RepID=UPI001D05ED7B|nr:actin-binding protein IPP [Coccinella septempunctata]
MAPLKFFMNSSSNSDVKKKHYLSSMVEEVDDIEIFQQEYICKILDNLNSMRINGKCCDLEIIAGKKSFKVHKAILAASSPYFQAMFTGELSEKNKNEIELHGISAEIFEVLLEFIYSGSVHINQNNVQDVFFAGDMLGLTDIVESCTKFLVRELQPQNAIGFYRFADDLNAKELKSESEKYIQLNFVKVSGEDEILQLSKDLLIKFISTEYLRIDSEQQVFDFALRWINHDIENRRQYVFEILKHIRLSLIPLEILKKTFTDCSDSSVRVALKSFYNDILEKKFCLVSGSSEPREWANRYIYVLGGSKREMKSFFEAGLIVDYLGLEKFDISAKKWIRVPDMSIDRLMPGVATLNGQIYVVGGETYSYVLSSCETYNPLTNQWNHVANMHTPRCDFGLCALDGYLYAVGGWVNDKEPNMCDSIERYDPKSDQWTVIGHLSEPRFSMGLVSHDDLLYLVGGCSSSRIILKDLKSYNPATGEWRELPSMRTPRWQMGVAVLGDYLYVVGGSNKEEYLNSVERYDIKQNKWDLIPPMNTARSGAAVVSLNGLLYVIGGTRTHALDFYRMQCTISSVESFDPITNTWSECPPLTESRAEGRAAVI